MARKKAEPISNLGNDDKLTVLKSRPLLSLWQSELTLAEFKILDTYLGRIDSHNPDKRVVTFEKGELEEKLGVTKISKSNLELRLKHLMGNVIKVSDKEEKKGFRLITLFEEAEAEQDDYGQWKVNLECTRKAMKYIFNVDHIGYLRYKLRCITSITSRYTYIMFCYLESHRRIGLSWEVSLDELKEILACNKEETYKEYKHFNNLILKKVQKEMHEKTECRYSYEPIKKGRSVVAIRLTLEPQQVILEEAQEDTNQYFDEIKCTEQEKRDKICNGFSSEEFEDFSNEELEILKDIAWTKKDESRVKTHNELLNNYPLACEFATADYLRVKIKMAKIHKPKNLFLYLKKMIETDEI